MLHLVGIYAAISIVVLSLVYAYYGWQLYKKCSREAARSLMFCSFFYLPLALLVMVLDKV